MEKKPPRTSPRLPLEAQRAVALWRAAIMHNRCVPGEAG